MFRYSVFLPLNPLPGVETNVYCFTGLLVCRFASCVAAVWLLCFDDIYLVAGVTSYMLARSSFGSSPLAQLRYPCTSLLVHQAFEIHLQWNNLCWQYWRRFVRQARSAHTIRHYVESYCDIRASLGPRKVFVGAAWKDGARGCIHSAIKVAGITWKYIHSAIQVAGIT